VREADYPASLLDLTNPKWKSKIAMAKPQFGTTATQVACLFEVLGQAKAEEFYKGLNANSIHLVAGNKNVATGVSSGQFAMGLTDTDDAIIEVLAGKPVAIIFPDRVKNAAFPRLGVLYIPNALAVVKGSPNPAGAKKLIDHLLNSETALAEGGGYQIPLNPKVNAKLPKELLVPSQVHVMDVDFEKAADLWDEVQTFLRDEFAK
jgi:iron(III) transport system substrate-binding protein